jgi:hypothetical protein
MALGMLPTARACTPRDAAFEFAVVGDAATAVSAIRWAAHFRVCGLGRALRCSWSICYQS